MADLARPLTCRVCTVRVGARLAENVAVRAAAHRYLVGPASVETASSGPLSLSDASPVRGAGGGGGAGRVPRASLSPFTGCSAVRRRALYLLSW